MLQQNIKTQICKHQLAWILADLLDEKEISILTTQCGIRDAPAQIHSCSVDWLIENLAEAFFGQETAEQTVHECLVQKAEQAIRRVGYMNVDEIQTFLRSSTYLVEGGDFTEIVWALLIDARQDVQQHGQKLLREYEQSVHAVTSVSESMASEQDTELTDTKKAVHSPEHKVSENIGASQALNVHVDTPPQKPTQTSALGQEYAVESNQRLDQLQETVNQLQHKYTIAENENENLKGQLQQLFQDNQAFREKEHQFTEQETCIRQLQQENHNLKREIEKLSNQSAELHTVHKVAQAEFALELKSIEEVVYRSHQTVEQMQSDLQMQMTELRKFSEMSKTALVRTRDRVTKLSSQHGTNMNSQTRMMKEQPSVGVFVDVQNMFYAAKDRYAGRVDYIKLLDLIVGPRQLVVAYAYVVQIPEINQSGFLSLLEHNGYTIKSKDLRLRGDGSAKGDWDVGIAIDIVSMLEALDVVILASGDGDFCALAELIKQQGKRVEVVAFEHNTSMDLQRMVDQFFPIGDELLI